MAPTGLRNGELSRLVADNHDERRCVVRLVNAKKNWVTEEKWCPESAREVLIRFKARAQADGHLIPGRSHKSKMNHISSTLCPWQRYLNEPRLHARALRPSSTSRPLGAGRNGPLEHSTLDTDTEATRAPRMRFH
ncbi:hypothetical protein Pla86_06230 [Planctomycetes bacterium Pla86]|uniref:Phage integrase family protein n=1 Tax=Engelhardtia mirabilis TaxID=2528011 RepID=A0A518BEZ9_9BACT|nr:hypothetical protein Pla133_06240 [Planctomycetes bacterium Pla133]QDU99884.1 hypothetical protein Pla86_06230 [Planctomycetes bacterium Pla86]